MSQKRARVFEKLQQFAGSLLTVADAFSAEEFTEESLGDTLQRYLELSVRLRSATEKFIPYSPFRDEWLSSLDVAHFIFSGALKKLTSGTDDSSIKLVALRIRKTAEKLSVSLEANSKGFKRRISISTGTSPKARRLSSGPSYKGLIDRAVAEIETSKTEKKHRRSSSMSENNGSPRKPALVPQVSLKAVHLHLRTILNSGNKNIHPDYAKIVMDWMDSGALELPTSLDLLASPFEIGTVIAEKPLKEATRSRRSSSAEPRSSPKSGKHSPRKGSQRKESFKDSPIFDSKEKRRLSISKFSVSLNMFKVKHSAKHVDLYEGTRKFVASDLLNPSLKLSPRTTTVVPMIPQMQEVLQILNSLILHSLPVIESAARALHVTPSHVTTGDEQDFPQKAATLSPSSFSPPTSSSLLLSLHDISESDSFSETGSSSSRGDGSSRVPNSSAEGELSLTDNGPLKSPTLPLGLEEFDEFLEVLDSDPGQLGVLEEELEGSGPCETRDESDEVERGRGRRVGSEEPFFEMEEEGDVPALDSLSNSTPLDEKKKGKSGESETRSNEKALSLLGVPDKERTQLGSRSSKKALSLLGVSDQEPPTSPDTRGVENPFAAGFTSPQALKNSRRRASIPKSKSSPCLPTQKTVSSPSLDTESPPATKAFHDFRPAVYEALKKMSAGLIELLGQQCAPVSIDSPSKSKRWSDSFRDGRSGGGSDSPLAFSSSPSSPMLHVSQEAVSRAVAMSLSGELPPSLANATPLAIERLRQRCSSMKGNVLEVSPDRISFGLSILNAQKAILGNLLGQAESMRYIAMTLFSIYSNLDECSRTWMVPVFVEMFLDRAQDTLDDMETFYEVLLSPPVAPSPTSEEQGSAVLEKIPSKNEMFSPGTLTNIIARLSRSKIVYHPFFDTYLEYTTPRVVFEQLRDSWKEARNDGNSGSMRHISKVLEHWVATDLVYFDNPLRESLKQFVNDELSDENSSHADSILHSVNTFADSYTVQNPEQFICYLGLPVYSLPFTQYHSFLDSYPVADIAEQFTLFDATMYHRVPKSAILNQAWEKERYRIFARPLKVLIRRIDRLAHWTATMILMNSTKEARVRTLSILIALAYHLSEMKNYFSFMGIMTGLNMAAVSRLSHTFKGLHEKTTRYFKSLSDVADPAHSFGNLRALHDSHRNTFLVPYVGTVLGDVTLIGENMDFIEEDGEKCINLEKHQMMSKSVRAFCRWQKYPIPDSYVEKIPLYPLVFSLVTLPEDKLYQISLELEPRGCSAEEVI